MASLAPRISERATPCRTAPERHHRRCPPLRRRGSMVSGAQCACQRTRANAENMRLADLLPAIVTGEALDLASPEALEAIDGRLSERNQRAYVRCLARDVDVQAK